MRSIQRVALSLTSVVLLLMFALGVEALLNRPRMFTRKRSAIASKMRAGRSCRKARSGQREANFWPASIGVCPRLISALGRGRCLSCYAGSSTR